MKRLFFLFLTLCFLQSVAAQDSLAVSYDDKYREDQFYLGITYNILLNKPIDVSQNGISNGLYLGYIRDMPINKNRNKAIGIGLGYNLNTHFTNLKAVNTTVKNNYEIISGSDFDTNRYIFHVLEMPIEYRWRTSNAKEYSFWRIYGGLKLGYVFANSFVYRDADEAIRFTNSDFRSFQYGLHLSVGYNTWNVHVYYGLNTLFGEDAVIAPGQQVGMRTLKAGLMFYIL